MPAEVYRFEALKTVALRSLSGQQLAALTEEQKKHYVARYLLSSSGIDLKGRLVVAHTAAGGGASVQASFNPLGVAGLNLGVDVGASFKGAKQRSVVVLRGPASILASGRAIDVPKPLVLDSFIGFFGELKVMVGIDLSVGWTAKLSDTASSENGVSGKTKNMSVLDEAAEERDEKPTNYEMLALGIEAKAGFEIRGSYTYDWFYAEDPVPLYSERKVGIENALTEVLEEGSTKTFYKKKAIAFINANSVHFGSTTMTLHQDWLVTTTTTGHAEILKVMRQYVDQIKVPRVKDETKQLIRSLSHFEKPGDGTCFLAISSHQPEGKAGAYASFEASSHVGGIVGYGVGASAFLGAKGSFKCSSARYQTRWPSERGPDVVATFDTQIKYSHFFLGAEFEFEADYTIAGKNLVEEPVKKAKKALEEASEKLQYRPDSLNMMTYRTSIVFWEKPPPLSAKPRGGPTSVETPALRGTGIALGGSFVVKNLMRVYEEAWVEQNGKFSDEAAEMGYVKLVAATLQIPPASLLEFLADEEVRGHITHNLPEEMGVLIEATYRVQTDVSVNRDKNDDGSDLAQLDKNTGTKLFGAPAKELESIRLRYRLRDMQNDDKTVFSVGFKVCGNGFKIKLDSVDRAGSEGIFDLRTVFVDDQLKALIPRERVEMWGHVRVHRDVEDVAAPYEAAVPAAVLFCQ